VRRIVEEHGGSVRAAKPGRRRGELQRVVRRLALAGGMNGHGSFHDLLERGDFAIRFERVVHAADPERAHCYEALVTGRAGTTLERGEVLLGCVRRKGAHVAFDRASVRAALAAARELRGEPRIALNLQAVTLAADFGFLSFLADTAEENGIGPERLVLEIAEDVAGWQQRGLLEALAGLRAIGARLCLDDVGCGHSNYKMMLDCRPDYFKVGSYFVRGSAADVYRQAVLRSILELGRRFGAHVIAEGVEAAADFRLVESLGVPLVQGSLFESGAAAREGREPLASVA
jgi:EAL domain-containing protein (putative c-di-GMP-specific phosphodiesterase class I)